MNHHQLPLSLELAEHAGVEYTFVSMEEVPQSRLALGYEDMDKKYPVVLRAYASSKEHHQAKVLLDESDVVILGSAPVSFLTRRLRQGKLTFQYSERFFKRADGGLKQHIRNRVRAWKHFVRFQGQPLYFLCSSAYTAADVLRYADYTGKMFRWGYFPQTVRWPSTESLMAVKEPAVLLWVGRLLDWKHPEHAVEVARRLQMEKIPFRLEIIGTGPEQETLLRQVGQGGVGKQICFRGAIPASEVRTHMNKAAVFLFTSDRQEGWGAVLNEAMNSGCAVVANHEAGASPYLIRDGINGLLYENRNVDALYRSVKGLLLEPERAVQMGRKAYLTITQTWNAQVAAQRFVALAQALQAGDPPPFYQEGPCSPAPILSDNWYPAKISPDSWT